MMTYTIDGPEQGDTFEAAKPQTAWRELARRLKVSGPRTLKAYGGPYEVTASLYDRQDAIVNVDTQRKLKLPR